MIWLLVAIILILIGIIVYLVVTHDGEVVMTKNEEGKKTYSLILDMDPEEIEKMRYLKFKVVKVAD